MLFALLAPVTKMVGLAANCTFTFSDADAEVGETFPVTLTWSTADSDLGAFTAELSYDSSALELVSGDVKLAPLPQTASGVQTVTFSHTFKALKAGITSVSIVPGNAYSFSTMEKMESTVKAGTVTITEPATEEPTTEPATEAPTEVPTEPPTEAPTEPPTQPPTTEERPTEGETMSSDATLHSLSVSPGSLSPAFSPDVQWYAVYVDHDVTRITVSVDTEEVNATYTISDTYKNLEVGKNYVGIKVTAQDGSERWYEMYVYRAAAPTDAPTGEPTDGPTDGVTDAPTDEPATENETKDPLAVTIGSVNGTVQETLGEVSRPEGFEEVTYNYHGVEIEALEGIGKELLLIPISDGSSTKLYIYREENGGFYPYVGIQTKTALYTVLPFDANETVPTGYSLTTVDFQGTLIDAWVRSDAADKTYTVFYAMNWDGETSLYRYDAEENTIQRINKSELTVGTNQQSPSTGTDDTTGGNGTEGNNGNQQVSDDYLEYYEETLRRVNRRDTFMFILMVILLACMIAMYLLFVVGGNKETSDKNEETAENSEHDAGEEGTVEDASEEDDDEEDIDVVEDEDIAAEEDGVAEDEDEAVQNKPAGIQVGMADFTADLSETEDAVSEETMPEIKKAVSEETTPEMKKAVSEEAAIKAKTVEDFDSEMDDLEDDDLEDLDLGSLE